MSLFQIFLVKVFSVQMLLEKSLINVSLKNTISDILIFKKYFLKFIKYLNFFKNIL